MAIYKTIARQFSWGGSLEFQDYLGEAIASEEAFFLVIRGHAFESIGIAVAGPIGFLGELVATGVGVIAGELVSRKNLYECDLRDLPGAIVEDPTWPISPDDEGRVIVIPRSVVERLYYPWWEGSLRIYTEEIVFYITPHFFFRWSVIRFLRSGGWKI